MEKNVILVQLVNVLNEKLHITWKQCESGKKESEIVFYYLARNGIKLCGDCVWRKNTHEKTFSDLGSGFVVVQCWVC